MPALLDRPATRRALAAVALLAASHLAAPAALGAQTTFFGQTPAAAASARDAFAASLGVVAERDLVGVAGTAIDFGAAFGTATVVGASVSGARITTVGAGSTAAFALRFAAPLTGFGATFTDVGSCCAGLPFADAVLTLTFLDGASTVGTIARQFGTSAELRGQAAFLGVSGLAAFDRVEVRTNVGDQFSVSRPVIGAGAGGTPVSTVPEPGATALLATGLAGLAGTGAARRRAVRAGRG